MQELRDGIQRSGITVVDPDDLDATIAGANGPDLNAEFVEVTNQQSALRKVLPTLVQRTVQAKREFNHALAAERQDEFTELENAVGDAYIALQSAVAALWDFEVRMRGLAQDDVRFKRAHGVFTEHLPDVNSTVQRDFYRGIDEKRLPANIKKLFGHVAIKEAA